MKSDLFRDCCIYFDGCVDMGGRGKKSLSSGVVFQENGKIAIDLGYQHLNFQGPPQQISVLFLIFFGVPKTQQKYSSRI